MSLVESMMEDCRLVEKRRTADGAGGFITEYVEGPVFKAAIVLDTSMQARIAEKQSVTSVYTITTHKNTVLDYHDIVKRTSDSRLFRVTSEGADKSTPASASLNMRQVSAEKWEVTTP